MNALEKRIEARKPIAGMKMLWARYGDGPLFLVRVTGLTGGGSVGLKPVNGHGDFFDDAEDLVDATAKGIRAFERKNMIRDFRRSLRGGCVHMRHCLRREIDSLDAGKKNQVELWLDGASIRCLSRDDLNELCELVTRLKFNLSEDSKDE